MVCLCYCLPIGLAIPIIPDIFAKPAVTTIYVTRNKQVLQETWPQILKIHFTESTTYFLIMYTEVIEYQNCL